MFIFLAKLYFFLNITKYYQQNFKKKLQKDVFA